MKDVITITVEVGDIMPCKGVNSGEVEIVGLFDGEILAREYRSTGSYDMRETFVSRNPFVLKGVVMVRTPVTDDGGLVKID